MNSISILLLIFMFSLAQAAWVAWNNPAYHNISSYPPLPSTTLGTYYSRFNPANPASVFATDRKTQYQWDLIVGGQSICTIYCDPKSYLTVDPAQPNNIVCKRDMGSGYWSNEINEGTTYNQYCIPDRSENCASNSNLKSLNTLPNKCSTASYTSTYADKQYDCCFNNEGGGLYHTQMKDEVDKSVTSSPTGLRMSQ